MIFIASLSANDQSNTVHTPIIRINKPHTQFFTLRWLYSPRVYDSGLNLLVQEWEVGGEGWRKTSTQISLLHHQTSAPQRERISYMVSNYILYGVYCLALATISYIHNTTFSFHAVVRSLRYNQPPSNVVQFPTKADLINFTKVGNSQASITIPQSLIQERMSDGSELKQRHSGMNALYHCMLCAPQAQ